MNAAPRCGCQLFKDALNSKTDCGFDHESFSVVLDVRWTMMVLGLLVGRRSCSLPGRPDVPVTRPAVPRKVKLHHACYVSGNFSILLEWNDKSQSCLRRTETQPRQHQCCAGSCAHSRRSDKRNQANVTVLTSTTIIGSRTVLQQSALSPMS